MKGFGPLFLASLMKVPTAWQMASILFTAPDPGEFWCAANRTADPCGSPCEEYSFRHDSLTFVTQWNLVCDRQYLVPLSQVCYLMGVLVGGVICTLLLRCISPRRILMGGMVLQVAAGLGVAFSTIYELQCFLRFVTASACTCSFTSGYVICADNKSGQARTVISACYEHMWSVGVITLALLGYLKDNWIQLQLAISIPTVLIIFTYPWIPDSSKWHLEKGKHIESKVNMEPKNISEMLSVILRKDTEVTWWELMQQPTCLALHIVWATTVVTYYGALLNVKSFGSHVHLNTAVIGISEIVGVLIGLAIILWFNKKKWMLLGSIMLTGGSASVACWGLPTGNDWAREWKMLGLGVFGKIAVAVSLTIIQLSSGELLPQVGIFSCVTIARVFLLSAPFIGYLAIYGDAVPLSSFGGITIVGGIAAFLIRKPTQPK